ncbi:MAG: Fe-S cluster assembly protein HesB [Candidatus Heimdallarchaeota archaeon]|nr:Fe-S cluster assembly protein HesB [Candidatus Heimdallarchaeota archaeon]
MIEVSIVEINSFQEKIFDWWKKNKRNLPWRNTTDPYYIMISEIMLQQTQVTRTIEKYLLFIEKYPKIVDLANAPTADVLKMWSGLGYNRRAIWLQEAAKQLLELEEFPKKSEELIKLKGIGPYTSKSILIFAFNSDIATVDTNIRRILIAEGFADETTSEKELFSIAEKLLPKSKSRDWHNALMDYGALYLTAVNTGIKPTSTQTRFKHSNRFHRGKIVKHLTQYREASFLELIEICGLNHSEGKEIISSLIKDGLIKEIKKKYTLP